MVVKDSPGVLAMVADCLARHHVSIQAVRQEASDDESDPIAPLGVMTHVALDAEIRATVAELEAMGEVNEGIRVMRVERI
jgi:homoserine dehydrogenase